MKKILIALFATASFAAGASGAFAETKTSTNSLTVKANLMNGCNIDFDNGGLIDFGNISVINGTEEKPGTFTVVCTNKMLKADGSVDKTDYKPSEVALSQGGAPNSKVTARLLENQQAAGKVLPFQVYQGTGTNTVWGDGSDGNAPVYKIDKGYGKDVHYDFLVKLLPVNGTTDGLTQGMYQSVMVATLTYDAVAQQ